MRKFFQLAAVGILAIAAAAPPAKSIFADIGVEIQEPLKKLTALEDEEKKLRTSEEAQIFASDAEKKQRARIESDITQLRMDGDQADRMRQAIVDMGCPPEGGRAPIELANRCNPRIDEHTALTQRLMARMESLKTQKGQVDQLRASIAETVLANVQKRKQIEADRAQLTSDRDRLQALAVAELIKRNKLGAAKACTSECCHRVIYDGADPRQCGVGLLCQSFQSAGLFGSGNRICAVGVSAMPILEQTGSTKAKPKWELEYDRKMAAYQQELARQQQAVEKYRQDQASMERKRAELRASAEKAAADWRAAVEACKRGDYSKCQ